MKIQNLIDTTSKIRKEKMAKIGITLGSDVPACLSGKVLKMEGRGEKLTNIGPIPNIPILLVNPNIKLATKTVFEVFSEKGSFKSINGDANVDVGEIFRTIERNAPNDLIETAIKLAPVIKKVLFALRNLKGVKSVGMSGSGATCFALFEPDDKVGIIKAKQKIKNCGWWTASTFLKGA